MADNKKLLWIVSVAAGCGCLVVISGIVAAILIPNLLDALQKAKQKRTIADVRSVGAAWMSWLADQDAAQAGEPGLPTQLTAQELSELLVPEYTAEVPATDGWQHPLVYALSPDLVTPPVLTVRSPGRDGLFEDIAPGVPRPFEPIEYDSDIVWEDGYFTSWPQAGGGG